MNFIDAIRSEKPIRRREKKYWTAHHSIPGAGRAQMICDAELDHWIDPVTLIDLYLDREDIIADDWEIKE